MTGTVRLFSKRGFGFIDADDTRESYFVHVSQTGWKALRAGDRVCFDTAVNPRNAHQTMAVNVALINQHPSELETYEQEAARS